VCARSATRPRSIPPTARMAHKAEQADVDQEHDCAQSQAPSDRLSVCLRRALEESVECPEELSEDPIHGQENEPPERPAGTRTTSHLRPKSMRTRSVSPRGARGPTRRVLRSYSNSSGSSTVMSQSMSTKRGDDPNPNPFMAKVVRSGRSGRSKVAVAAHSAALPIAAVDGRPARCSR